MATTHPEAAASLKRNGKTFWLASLFLPADTSADATLLYAFCRRLDDLADQGGSSTAGEQLRQVQQDLHSRRSEEPIVHAFLQLAERRHLDLRAADYLLEALRNDAAGDVRLQDQADLLRYCYGAAGTVGLMMAGVLNAKGATAGVQAVHLGIAMQLTNIARDVLEDARMGRRYLPGNWIGDLQPEQIAADAPDEQIVQQITQAIVRLLAMADMFYASGARGFPAIPSRARTGIQIAAAAYRQIGMQLQQRGCDFRRGRTIVSLPAKLKIAAGVLAGRSDLERLTNAQGAASFDSIFHQYPGFA